MTIINDNRLIFNELRNKYPVFIFEGFSTTNEQDSLKIQFNFTIPGLNEFHPIISIPKKKHHFKTEPNDPRLKTIIFSIGMIEMLSYWKATCSPKILIKPFTLDGIQIDWWKELYFNSMGEFFYVNGIEPELDSFVSFDFQTTNKGECNNFPTYDHTIVPIGGGKDSVATLEILKRNKFPLNCLIINPRPATIHTAEIAGFPRTTILEIHRSISPELLKLNANGFLNGHTPFSALLAFYSCLIAVLSGSKHIALSNESSANEPTVPGTKINHQYSKSYEFELSFRNYLYNYITKDINYFSFLRPLNELQIARIFSEFDAYHGVFRSCNAGSKTDSWCCECPKCLFTFIILSPFIDMSKLIKIFGNNLFDKPEYLNIFNQLCGISDIKPFDCVGTTTEINIALCLAIQKNDTPLPYLLDYYTKSEKFSHFKSVGTSYFFNYYDNKHFLLRDYSNLIRHVISGKDSL